MGLLCSDVVLNFLARVSETLYGTAGVIFQPLDTLQKDGVFAKHFDLKTIQIFADKTVARRTDQ